MSETFNSDAVKSKMSQLEGKFTEFATTLSEINTIVEDLVQNGEGSAVHGVVGQSLLRMWEENAATFQDFQANFDEWSKVVSVISHNNSEFEVAAKAIYKDNAGTLVGVADNKAAYVAGTATLAGITTNTTFKNGDSGETSESDGVKGTNQMSGINTAYQVNTEGNANQMYTEACDLKKELHVEKEYLTGYKMDLESSRKQLDLAYQNGKVSQEDYDKLSKQYDEKISVCASEIEKREGIYTTLEEITKNNFGTKDGVLKDARDFGANDVTTAQESLVKVNEQAATLTNVSEISKEMNGDGTVKNAFALTDSSAPNHINYEDSYAPSVVNYGKYNANLADVVVNEKMSVSNLTFSSAYAAAQYEKLELDNAPGVYLFNTAQYLQEGNAVRPKDGIGLSEHNFLSNATYKGYDSVYDSNTGNFYTYDEYSSLKGLQNDK